MEGIFRYTTGIMFNQSVPSMFFSFFLLFLLFFLFFLLAWFDYLRLGWLDGWIKRIGNQAGQPPFTDPGRVPFEPKYRIGRDAGGGAPILQKVAD